MNTPAHCTDSTHTPRDWREANLIAAHARDSAERWHVIVGPLIRRSSDGKLIRLPDIERPHTFDASAACTEFLLGRGPGRSHGMIHEWVHIARTFDSLDAQEQARLARMALRNHQVFQHNLAVCPPAAEDAPLFAEACRPIPPSARIHRFAPAAPAHRCEWEGVFFVPAAA